MSTPTILEKIKAYKLEHIAACKSERSEEDLLNAAETAPAPRGFYQNLSEAASRDYGLIAEIKKASPSKGLIREDFDAPTLARAYVDGGATCLSILTDAPSFQGDDSYLMAARDVVDLPILRKDFMYDPYQVIEARVLGADCILIIMASVSDAQATELEDAATRMGLDVLVEVHNAEELERASVLKSPMLGINNRDLHTFEVTLDTTRSLSKRVPADKLIIAESGIFEPDDLAELAQYGARSFLIGESLMRQEDVASATRHILSKKPFTRGM
ncbi:MAG: indole-3-glycerol phosphate synthase TrpC [Pseudomonadota bacterium]